MRYDNWDVILFPRDSPIPIQEFKTACYVYPDGFGHQLPTLTCYIAALAPSTPFRISVHSWDSQAKPSPIIDSQKKNNQKVVYTVQVIVDGARVFHDFYQVASKWPQEIGHEKRSITATEQITSQRKTCLEFPPFHQKILMQSSWDARDTSGRIRIILSEQLVSKTQHSPGELDFGYTNEIVCFSFQHAPTEVLEQAGISWPIRNPLFFPIMSNRAGLPSHERPLFSRVSKGNNTAPEARMHSPLSQPSRSTFARPKNPEPYQRPNTQPPLFSQFPKPPVCANISGRAGTRDDSFGSFGDSTDDINMDAWSMKQSNSIAAEEMATSDHMFASIYPPGYSPLWGHPFQYKKSVHSGWDNHLLRKKKMDRNVVVSLRDDQLEQIIEAISPPKKDRHSFGCQRQDQDGRLPTPHTYQPSKMKNVSQNSRPFIAAVGRIPSRTEFNNILRNSSNKPPSDQTAFAEPLKDRLHAPHHPSFSSNKENRPPSQSRLPTPFPFANRVPTPNPFVHGISTWDSDVEMRDPSSVFSSVSRFDQVGAHPSSYLEKIGPAHAPSTSGNVKSRKEALGHDSPKSRDQSIHHDQSLLPVISIDPAAMQNKAGKEHGKVPHNTPGLNASKYVEIIDVDAIDPSLSNKDPIDNSKLSPYKPGHKPGMSSMDSTGRLERQLFSALGEELGSFEQDVDTTDMGPELSQALPGSTAHSDLSGSTMLNPAASEYEPVGKRKRQGTFGADRDRSPLSKKEKARQMEVEEQDMPCLRGD